MKFRLNNSIEIPGVGLGTFRAVGEEVYEAVKIALKCGYRHIDTAAAYKNEKEVGRAIRDSGITREEIFVTTKLHNSKQGYETTKVAFYDSLNQLGLDYVDLYLIHWPTTYEKVRESWRAMEELYEENKIRAIGVSNFPLHHLDDLLRTCKIKPMMNQVELHPGLQQHKLKAYCDKYDICLTAYAPLMKGDIVNIEILKDLAHKYEKSVSNIVLRWGLQRGIILIPKSSNPERIRENHQVFDFELSQEDMVLIKSLNNGRKLYPDPDNINF